MLPLFLALASASWADTIITREGSSYSGQFLGTKQGTIGFTDTSGIGYTFPVKDVQSLVFTTANDTVTLRNGKVYSGKFTGADPLAFKDNLGILYEFPRKDVESLVISTSGIAAAPPPGAEDHTDRELRFIFVPTRRSIRTMHRPGSGLLPR